MQMSKQLPEVIHEWSKVFMHRTMRDNKRFMDEAGLSFPQINVLMGLFHGRNISVSMIGKQMGVSNPAASQAIDRLVQMGLIERTEDPEDRRAKRLTLTPKAQALMEKWVASRSQWVEGLTQALTPAQQEAVASALTLLTEAARKMED